MVLGVVGVLLSALFSTALDTEEVHAGAVDSHVHVYVNPSSSLLKRLIGRFSIGFSVALACLPDFVMFTLRIMRMSAFGLSLRLALVSS